MKYLFYLLLVANVVFYLWESSGQRSHSETDRVELKLPDEAPKIRLLNEVPKSARKPPAPVEPPPAAVEEKPPEVAVVQVATPESPAPQIVETAVNPSCRLYGPFADANEAKTALEQVQSRVQGIMEVISRTDAAEEGYWVLYPKAESIYAARANRKMLIDKGVRDLWLFDKGEMEGAISLGVFKTRSRAEQLQRELQAKDVAVEIKPRLARSETYWLRLSWPGDDDQLQQQFSPDQQRSISRCEN